VASQQAAASDIHVRIAVIICSSPQKICRSRTRRSNKIAASRQLRNKSFELDELYCFTGKRKGREKGVNAYIMTMISREPRQILGFEVGSSVAASSIQKTVDNNVVAENC
jgi:hypothetical protein